MLLYAHMFFFSLCIIYIILLKCTPENYLILLQKDVIIIVAVILLPIAALIGLTISQVVKSAEVRDDALEAQKDVENFLRVQELVNRVQVYMFNGDLLPLLFITTCECG